MDDPLGLSCDARIDANCCNYVLIPAASWTLRSHGRQNGLRLPPLAADRLTSADAQGSIPDIRFMNSSAAMR